MRFCSQWSTLHSLPFCQPQNRKAARKCTAATNLTLVAASFVSCIITGLDLTHRSTFVFMTYLGPFINYAYYGRRQGVVVALFPDLPCFFFVFGVCIHYITRKWKSSAAFPFSCIANQKTRGGLGTRQGW